MIKYLFIVINSLAVFLYSLFSGDNGVTVTGNIPATLKAGQEAAIEIKINKGSMGGFAKFQLELPDGIDAKEAENKGASYTYKAGIAKWVWASLPPENEIVIKITLISSEEATGIKAIQAKFSFVENNAKQVVEMTPAEITITTGDGAIPAVAKTTPDSTMATPPPATVQSNVTTSNNEPPGNINVARTISKGSSDNEYVVNIKIKKGATKGFARYSDDLPEGLTVKASKTEGSSFSIGDGKLKFVWVSVPEKEELELEYTISGNSNTPVALNGEYSYLEDNQSKKVKITPATITLPPVEQPVAGAPKEEASAAKTETQVTETIAPENTSASTQSKMEETLAKKEGKVDYHVQIGAFTNANVGPERLKKVFKVSENITSEMQGGFSKFMVGSHGEYKAARDHREVMKNNNGIKSAFVVAYNSGKRITVQEALMISNQKWFK